VNFLNHVVETVRQKLRTIEPEFLLNADVWLSLLPEFGFNHENPKELPAEMVFQPGLGLRIWQYPNQFAPYMAWLISKARQINSYMEIGTRHGGTFVMQVETLRQTNPGFNTAVAVDLIDQPDLLAGYEYRQQDSQSKSFSKWISKQFFDCIFIDGDHSYEGVKRDAELTIQQCNIQVFHDISSDSCLDVGIYWQEHKIAHKQTHNFVEFVDQYDSVQGSFLGIGVAYRKDWIVLK
jgi:hypothetical protein